MPTLSGIVRDSLGNLAARLVRAYRRDTGALVGQVISDATTGVFLIPTTYAGAHFAVWHDTADADIYWANKVLGLHFDGANGSTTITDVKGHTVTAYGNAQLSTAQSVFGGSSLLLDGNGDFLSITDSDDWDFPGDFSIRTRLRFNSHASNCCIVGNYQNSTTGWALEYIASGSTLRFYYAGDANLQFAWTPSNNVWYDLEVDRGGSSVRAFIGGSQIGATQTNSTSISGSTQPLRIGSLLGTADFLNAYVDEMDITKAVRHTANFTPATSAFVDGVSGGMENAQVLDMLIPV